MLVVVSAEDLSPELKRLFDLSDQHYESNDIEGAAELMRQATVLSPAFPGAWMNLGLAQWDLMLWEDAVASSFRAAELDPQNEDVYINLGSFLSTMRDPRAIDMLKRATILNPKNTDTLHALGAEYMWQGHFKDAVITFDKAEQLQTSKPEIMLQNSLIMPLVYTSTTQIELMRRRLVRSVRRLWKLALGEGHPLIDASDGTDWPELRNSNRGTEENSASKNVVAAEQNLPWNRPQTSKMPLIEELNGITMPAVFDVVYQGYANDRSLMEAISGAYAMMHPALITAAPHLRDGPPIRANRPDEQAAQKQTAVQASSESNRSRSRSRRKRVRVGFVSAYWFKHSVCKLLCGIIERLPQEDFEVFVFSAVERPDYLTARLVAAVTTPTSKGVQTADHFVQLPGSSINYRTRRLAEEAKLDVMVREAAHAPESIDLNALECTFHIPR
jgi:predicted O-linked N-acetylglucosamine transferase (SPINDLY family)